MTKKAREKNKSIQYYNYDGHGLAMDTQFNLQYKRNHTKGVPDNCELNVKLCMSANEKLSKSKHRFQTPTHKPMLWSPKECKIKTEM